MTGTFDIPRAGLIGNRNPEHKSTSVNDFDNAQDWKNAFKNLWQKTRWLKKFSIVNKLAMHDVKTMFMKNYFRVPDNSIDKQLKTFYKAREFSKSRKLKNLSRDIAVFYSLIFTKGDLRDSRNYLNQRSE